MDSTIQFPGYHITKKIYEGSYATVYKGIRDSDSKRIVIKVLKETFYSPTQIAQFKREYLLQSDLHEEGTVAALGLESHQDTLAIVLEDFGTHTLKQLLSERRITLHEFLTLAVNITEALEKIHEHQIIHKDINPANILIDSKTHQVKIIDFGIASTLPREELEVQKIAGLEGMLSYISPEQTGRMNRGIDYRADFYSLGVVFYEAATGMLPFVSDDILELIHSHITKTPQPPTKLNPSIPPIVSDIILKLLAKAAEDRYQSTYSLKNDLVNCLTQLKSSGNVEAFKLGAKDISASFRIPEKIYGRDKELKLLLSTFEATSVSSAELLLVTGPAGVGKSRLINEIHKPIVEKKGYFIKGKFDQFNRNVPYAAFISALEDLVEQILTENKEQIDVWKERILNAVGRNGQIVAEIIPSIISIIGPQAPSPILGPTETQNRFNYVFQNFLKALGTSEHPLVIFLDDLQWADPQSLKVLELFLTNQENKYVLIIGAYRDNEVTAVHPLITTLEKIRQTILKITSINLKSLDKDNIEELLVDTLHTETKDISTLATVVFEKTQGNSFFVVQFLHTIYKERLISFNVSKGEWQWNIERIKAKNFTDNVAEFTANKIKSLPLETRIALQRAAFIGNRFDLKTLAIISQKPSLQVAEDLWHAMSEGLINPINDSYKYATEENSNEIVYHFLHDRVQQAAYSLAPVKERPPIHLHIGRLLLKETPPEALSDSLLDILNHINEGKHLITDIDERIEFASLNLQAGNKAKTSIAHHAAFNYFKSGIELLPPNHWEDRYPLSIALHSEAVEAALLSNELEEMNRLFEITIKNAKSALDKVKIYEVMIASYTARHNFPEAIRMGIEALALFDIYWPEKPSKLKLLFLLLRTKFKLFGKKINDLENLPDMKDPRWKAVMNIIIVMGGAAYISNRDFYTYLVLESVRYTLTHGKNDYAPVWFVVYGGLCIVLNEIKKGYQFGILGLRFIKNDPSNSQIAKVECVFNFQIAHWQQHFNVCIDRLTGAIQKGLEVGDYQYVAFCMDIYTTFLLYSGKDLQTVIKEIENLSTPLLKLGRESDYLYLQITWSLCLKLIGKSDEEVKSTLAWFDKKEALKIYTQWNSNPGLINLALSKIIIHYFNGEYQKAYDHSHNHSNYAVELAGSMWEPYYYFYEAVSALAYYHEASDEEKKTIIKRINKLKRRFKFFSKVAPMNYAHKYYLILAEEARINKRVLRGIQLYEKSISTAKENGFIQDAALASECAAKFFFELGRDHFAGLYINEAYFNYIRWGCILKVKQLENNYPQYTVKERLMDTSRSPTPTLLKGSLDMSVVMKSTEAISKEIILEDLLKNMMHLIIEGAGAQRGILLFEKNGRWYIEAQQEVDGISNLLQSVPLEGNVPTKIISYVLNTKEPVILEDAMIDPKFNTDPYITRTQPKSILCMPLIKGGIINAILYLENNLIPAVFTADRINLLALLSGQMIISIDNAKLYTNTIKLNEELSNLNKAYERFVPKEFLSYLGKKSIIDVELGDQSQREMTVLFSDIRNFTKMSEQMTPKETFAFLNNLLGYMEPVISGYNGFIDKYLGDGIMALFPKAENAVSAAISMLQTLDEFNMNRVMKGHEAIRIGIGINSGTLMLGTVGEEGRMDSTVVSDAVNLASRVETLNKEFGTALLLTQETYKQINETPIHAIRRIGSITIRGKEQPVNIYEVFAADYAATRELKLKTLPLFEKAITMYENKQYSASLKHFKEISLLNPNDNVVKKYLDLCLLEINKKS